MGKAVSITIEDSFKEVKPKSCYGWFEGAKNVTEIKGLTNLDTSNCTNMNSMFALTGFINLDLTSFKTSKVKVK